VTSFMTCTCTSLKLLWLILRCYTMNAKGFERKKRRLQPNRGTNPAFARWDCGNPRQISVTTADIRPKFNWEPHEWRSTALPLHNPVRLFLNPYTMKTAAVGSRIFTSPYRPHRLYGPASILANGYCGLFLRR
jgi:hypothetical protein